MDEFVVKETSVWGDSYRAKRPETVLRLKLKSGLLRLSSWYPIIDHVKKYCFKPKGQKGPARESQTFIVSYAYNYDHIKFIDQQETDLRAMVERIGLSWYKEPCVFRGKPAYKILIMDADVKVEDVIDRVQLN